MRFHVLICFSTALVLAQEFDTVLNRTSRKAIRIVDEIEGPAERKCFLEIYREKNALNRRSLATRFLQQFPASWFTAQVLEAASKASMELGDDAAAVYYGTRSLRIYPENPLLLVPLAALQSKRGEREATKDATSALEYLARFAAPAGMNERDWLRIRDELREVALRIGGKVPDVRAPRKAESHAFYAGSSSCLGCHLEQFTNWSDTGMAKMLRTVRAEAVFGDFEEATFAERTSAPEAKMTREGRHFYVHLRRTGGTWDRYEVTHTIGSKWQQAYITRSSSGEMHVLPLQYNRIQKRWTNYWRLIDPDGSERAVTGEFHRLSEVTSYLENCAPCHTSQFRSGKFREPGVNCEMCHGPSAAHAKGQPAPFRFSEATNREYVDVCAQCHAQSAIRKPSSFPPRYERRPYSEFSRRAFYRDGRFRETTFIVEAFQRSACFRKGQAHCGHCHNPHPSDAGTNPASLKYRDKPDTMCLQCHSPSLSDVRHTKHPTSSEGARCTSCHMPKIMNSLMFRAASHEIDDTPDAAMTAQFGATESPNACLLCHDERNALWVSEQLRSW